MASTNSARPATMASCCCSPILSREASGLVYSSPSQSSSSTSLDSPDSLLSDEELDRRREQFFDQWLEEDDDVQRACEMWRVVVPGSGTKVGPVMDMYDTSTLQQANYATYLGHNHLLPPPVVNICPPSPDIDVTPIVNAQTLSIEVTVAPSVALSIPAGCSPPSCTRKTAKSSKKRVAFAPETPPDREDDDLGWAKRFGRCSGQANAQPGKGLFTFELKLSQDDLMRNR